MSGDEKKTEDASVEEKEPQQHLYVTAFMQSMLSSSKEPTYVMTVTVINMDSPAASHFEYGVCKTKADFLKLDAVLRMSFAQQLRGVTFPEKKKKRKSMSSNLLRRGKSLKKKQQRMGQYLSKLLLLNLLPESEHLRRFLLLDTMPMPVILPDGEEVLQEQKAEDAPVGDEEGRFSFTSDTAAMDQMEKKAVDAMNKAVVDQKEAVKRLRHASVKAPSNAVLVKKLKEQEVELERMEGELKAVENIEENSEVTPPPAPENLPVMNMPSIEVTEETLSVPEPPSLSFDMCSASDVEESDTESEASTPRAQEDSHAKRSFRLSMVLRVKKQSLRQTVNFDLLVENGELDSKYLME